MYSDQKLHEVGLLSASLLGGGWYHRKMFSRCLFATMLVCASCVESESVYCSDGTVCPPGTTCDLERDLCIAPGQLEACANKVNDDPCTFAETAGLCYQGLCTTSTCGDMRIGPGEVCDDGDLNSGDGCRSDCRSDETCGNGVIDHEVGEDCDCGATEVALGCADVNSMTSTIATCRVDCKYRCGDQSVQPGEVCDGPPPSGETCLDYGYDRGLLTCSSICTPAFAGCDRIGWVSSEVGVANPRLNAVWGADADNVFAVTDFDGVVRWNGTAWSKMTVPAGLSYLYGIWGRSKTDVYAVGNGGVVIHYDGTAWTQVASGTSEPLFAVHGDNTRVTAVGGALGKTVMTESVGGGSWAATTITSGTARALFAVVVHGGAATAVGAEGHVCHRATTSWACNNNGNLGDLRSVAVIDTTVYAGGVDGMFSDTVPPDAANFSAITARAFGSVGSLTTVGQSLIVAGDRVYRFDAAIGWYRISESAVPNAGIWAGSLRDMWAVGLGARHFAGTTWAHAPTNVAVDLERVAAGAPGVFAIGASELIAFVGGAWTRCCDTASECPVCYAAPTLDPVGVSVGTDIVVAIDSNGSLHTATEPYTSFSEWTSTMPVVAKDVWIKDQAHDAYTLSFPNQVFRRVSFGGGNWLQVGTSLATSFNMNSIWGFADNDLYVAGGGGSVFHWNGADWTMMSTGVVQELRKIWGSSPTDVWAVGQVGTILHYNGVAWTKHDSGTLSTLESVWGTGPNDVFATGGDTLLHYDGTGWVPMRDSTEDQMNDVFGYGDYVHFVGRNGGSQLLVRY